MAVLHLNQTKDNIISLYPELQAILGILSQIDQKTLTSFIRKKDKQLEKHPEVESLVKNLVTSINRAEIKLTTGIIIFGSTLALLQGQLTEFKTQIESEVLGQNPAIYNLLSLEALILKGNNFEAFSWITKSLHVYTAENQIEYENIKDIIKGEEIFTHSLAYYCYQLMGKNEEANNALEEANRLHSLSSYKWTYYYFWLIYFRALIALNLGIFEEAIQHADEAYNLSINQVNHRIYQALSLQIKGRALIGIGKIVDALNLFLEAAKLFELTNSIFSISIYADIAILESKVGRYINARDYFKKTIIETEMLSGGGLEVAPLLQLPGYRGLAELYLLQGNYFSAEDAFLKTLKLAKNTNTIDLEAYTLEKLGSINTDLKKYSEAQNYFIESLQITTDSQLNKTQTLLEYGRLALLMNNIELAQTQLWYLRNLSQTKNLGLEIILFKSQIMMHEKKFDICRLELEKIQLRSVLKNIFQIRIQVALAKLSLKEIDDDNPDYDEIDEKDQIEEFIDRITLIKPFLEKETFSALKILFILLDILSNYLKFKEDNTNRKYYISKLEEASDIANIKDNKLIHLSQLVDFYKRRFSRKRIRLNISHSIELIENLERVLIQLSKK